VDAERGIWVVADGVGGEPGGDVASIVATTTVAGYFDRSDRSADPETVRTRMRMAIGVARQGLLDQAVGPLARMATTIAALWVADRSAVVANVGDSPVYLWRDGKLTELTRAHVVEARMQNAAGDLIGPPPGTLTRALGAGCDGRPDLNTIELRPRDVVLLCTDGISKPLGSAGIAAILGAAPAEFAARILTSEAIACGGRDNATALLAVVDP
jgi:serine/threonine protein phosphatase PrpC